MRALISYAEEGREAYYDGETVESCPYKEDTVRYHEWRSGWFDICANDRFSHDDDNDDPLDFSSPREMAAQDHRYAKRAAEVRLFDAHALLPKMEEVIAVLGPTDGWVSNCYAVSKQLFDAGLLAPLEAEFGPVKLCYGQYWGWVSKDSVFHNKPVVRHGWLEFEEGIVVDPTRWVFHASEPALALTNVEDYDLAARRFRERTMGDKKPPVYDAEQGVIRWTINNPETTKAVAELLGEQSRVEDGFLARGQAFWLANRSLAVLKDKASDIYQALDALGLKALIPVDNRNYLEAFSSDQAQEYKPF